jgi:hypothetical protein
MAHNGIVYLLHFSAPTGTHGTTSALRRTSSSASRSIALGAVAAGRGGACRWDRLSARRDLGGGSARRAASAPPEEHPSEAVPALRRQRAGQRSANGRSGRRAVAQHAWRDRPAGDAECAPGPAAPPRKADRKRPRPARAARAGRTGVEDVAARQDRLDDRPASYPQRAVRWAGGHGVSACRVGGPSPPKFRTLAGAWGSGNGPATRAGQEQKGDGI